MPQKEIRPLKHGRGLSDPTDPGESNWSGFLSDTNDLHPHDSATIFPTKLVNTLSQNPIYIGSYIDEHWMYIPILSRM